MAKYSQKFVNKAHDLKESGLTIKELAKQLKLSFNQATYILYSKSPTLTKAQLAKELEPGLNAIFGTEQKPLDELYADRDKAVKEVDTILKRIKRLLFGS